MQLLYLCEGAKTSERYSTEDTPHPAVSAPRPGAAIPTARQAEIDRAFRESLRENRFSLNENWPIYSSGRTLTRTHTTPETAPQRQNRERQYRLAEQAEIDRAFKESLEEDKRKAEAKRREEEAEKRRIQEEEEREALEEVCCESLVLCSWGIEVRVGMVRCLILGRRRERS